MLSGASEATLGQAFALRRCVICGSADVALVCVGSEAEYIDRIVPLKGGGARRVNCLLRPAVADVNFCLLDASTRWRASVGPPQRGMHEL